VKKRKKKMKKRKRKRKVKQARIQEILMKSSSWLLGKKEKGPLCLSRALSCNWQYFHIVPYVQQV
jgi:hypothetical protein